MTLDEFVEKFADEFTETPASEITAETKYRELKEWGSLTALSILSMIDEEYDQMLAGATLRKFETVKELYEYVESL
jgi:acyl carrier protein